MPEWLVAALSLPLITAFIGYITNWAAVKMIFHPSRFVGVGPIGWQGVIYRLAPKLAGEIAATTSKVLTPADVVGRVRAGDLVDRVAAGLDREPERLTADLLEQACPGAWARLDDQQREKLTTEVVAGIRAAVEDAAVLLAPDAGEFLDLDQIVVDMLSGPNSDRLARVAKEVGERELRFIELYGGVFGFMVGVVQAAAYSVFSQWWLMPIVGGIVGLGTNWLAIQMIFRPFEQTRYLGLVTYQGMFPKRQPEIAADYGRISATEILPPAKLLEAAAGGPGLAVVAPRLLGTLQTHMLQIAEALGRAGGDGRCTVDAGALTATTMQRVAALAPRAKPIVEAHLGEHLAIDQLIEDRLGRLSKPEFERMLRGIFEEDEFILVAIGGVLGAAVGALQAVLVLTLAT